MGKTCEEDPYLTQKLPFFSISTKMIGSTHIKQVGSISLRPGQQHLRFRPIREVYIRFVLTPGNYNHTFIYQGNHTIHGPHI